MTPTLAAETPSSEALVAEYSYTDENSNPLYQMARLRRNEGLRQRYRDSAGTWIWGEHPHQVLYHLREVLENPIIFICESERDVECLRDQGFVATTHAGGVAAPWLKQYTEALRGREVILIPHNNPAGRQRVLGIARALTGHVVRLVILTLDGEGIEDVSDWFAAGHSELELIRVIDPKEDPCRK